MVGQKGKSAHTNRFGGTGDRSRAKKAPTHISAIINKIVKAMLVERNADAQTYILVKIRLTGNQLRILYTDYDETLHELIC